MASGRLTGRRTAGNIEELRVCVMLHAGGPGKKQNRDITIVGDVAQLVRALPCHGRGRGFEPRRPRHHSKALRMMGDPKKTKVAGLIWVQ